MTTNAVGPRQCPKCKLLNEPGAETCDCGYDFLTGKKGAPRTVWRGTAPPPSAADFAAIERGAAAYRRLIALVAVNAVTAVAIRIAPRLVDREAALLAAAVGIVISVGLGFLSAHAAYGVAVTTGAGSPSLYAIAALVPCISLWTLLALSSRATEWARRNGLEVGLMGPKRESLDALRRTVRR